MLLRIYSVQVIQLFFFSGMILLEYVIWENFAVLRVYFWQRFIYLTWGMTNLCYLELMNCTLIWLELQRILFSSGSLTREALMANVAARDAFDGDSILHRDSIHPFFWSEKLHHWGLAKWVGLTSPKETAHGNLKIIPSIKEDRLLSPGCITLHQPFIHDSLFLVERNQPFFATSRFLQCLF